MKTRVYFRKLPPTKRGDKLKPTLGWCDTATGEIWVHPDQPESELMDTLIHEALHLAFPKMGEKRVIKGANLVSDVLWKKGYRRK